MKRTNARRIHKNQTVFQKFRRRVKHHRLHAQPVICIFLLADVGRQLFKRNRLHHTVLKVNLCGFIAVQNLCHRGSNRHNTHRQNVIFQNRIGKGTFPTLKLTDYGNCQGAVFQFIRQKLHFFRLTGTRLIRR